MLRKIMALGILIVISFSLLALAGCTQKPSDFSEEEHIKRVSELVEQRYMKDNEEYTGFNVYPLFDGSDELIYFLVEFEPFGFVYVKTNKTGFLQQLFWGISMYTRAEGETWQRYRICEDGEEPMPYEGRQWQLEDADEYGHIQYPNRRWEVDEAGEFIYYKVSHFKAANIEDEERYLLRVKDKNTHYIPAVKRENKYLNLVSMEEMEYEQDISSEECSYSYIYFIPKPERDL